MADFYKILEEKRLIDILDVEEYESPEYIGWEKVKSFFLDIVQNNRSVYLESDYDVDGLMSACTIMEGLKKLGVKNLKVYQYRSRTHSVDRVAINQCIQGHYDYFIVTDTGSSDFSLLKSLTKYGIKVIILDHHVTEMSYEDYPDDIAIINTTIENRTNDVFRLSAGALCFTVMDLLYRELGKDRPTELAAFATVSLFADVMDMQNKLNRAIYYLGVKMPKEELPKQVAYFLTEYNRFNARYISYWFSPRVNACFRAEEFDLINYLFLQDSDSVTKSVCIKEIEVVYTAAREMIGKVSDIIEVTQLKNFVIADLASVDRYISVHDNKLWNYTGLVANKLSERFGKTAVTTCRTDAEIKGSVRDLFGRNYLPIFKQLCYAGGHNAAFGLKIKELDYSNFLIDLHRVDTNFSIQGIANRPLIMDWDYQSPDEQLFRDIARYNEFVGPNVPIFLIRKQYIGAIYEKISKYGYKYVWEDMEIQSDSSLSFGQWMLLRPFNSWKLKLQVETGGV